jgi:hypothetical protein
MHHYDSYSTNNSIPPSPALNAFDIFGNGSGGGAVKRSRGMSLGFSMPMVELEEQQ